MKTFNTFVLILIVGLGWLNVERSEAQVVLPTVERSSLLINKSTFLPVETVPGTLVPVASPDHGDLIPWYVAVDSYLYSPNPNFIGIDRLSFTGKVATGTRPQTFQVEIQVLPESLPVTGRFFPGLGEGVGMYRTRDQSFDLCTSFDGLGYLHCVRAPVTGLTGYFLPVVGDWDGDGYQVPSLFDPATATLHLLTWSADGSALHPRGTRTFVGLEHTLPLAGNWRIGGHDELLLLTTRGQAHVVNIGRGWSGDQDLQSDFYAAVPVPGDGSMPWPVRWWQHQDADGLDALAVVDQRNGKVRWIGETRNGVVSTGEIQITRSRGHRIPFVSGFNPLSRRDDLFYLQADFDANGFSYEFHHWSVGGPQTMPLKFPNDPPDL